MAVKHILMIGAAAGLLAACDAEPSDKSYDRNIGGKQHLSQLKAGIWIDPEGCDHWIIDDGLEGYLTARVDDYGKPICSGAGPAATAVGPFKQGGEIRDPVRPSNYVVVEE